MKTLPAIAVVLGLMLALPGSASPDLSAPAPDGLRPGGSLAESHPAPMIAPPERDARSKPRSHPYLPPVVPHHVRNHQIDLNANRCLSCHDVGRAEAMLAPAMSRTHYRDRSGSDTDQIAGSRYLCLKCHVAQQQVEAPIGNTFFYRGRRHAPLDR